MKNDSKNCISVLLCTFNSKLEDVFFTLNSILGQKSIDLEVIVCDDASKENHKEEIISYFKDKNFTNYQLSIQKENAGTVKNLLAGLELAKYDYVKPIGAGDTFYKEETCNDVVSFMKENELKLCFVDAVYFNFNNNQLNIVNHSQPMVRDIYNIESFNLDTIKKNLLFYGDYILGASLFYKKELFHDYLDKFKDKVIYEEDILSVAEIAEGNKIARYPGYGVFYEFGSGISTKNNSFNQKLINDTSKVLEYLSLERNEKYAKKGLKLLRAKKALKPFISPSFVFFKLKAKKVNKQVKPEPQLDFFNSCKKEVKA